MERLADLIDRLNDGIGEVLKWAMPVIALICAVVAVLRYGFGVGFPWLSESYIWLNGALFTLGAAYVLRHEGHVRVDVFYNLLSARGRAWINLLGTLVFLYPMLYFLAVKGWPASSAPGPVWKPRPPSAACRSCTCSRAACWGSVCCWRCRG